MAYPANGYARAEAMFAPSATLKEQARKSAPGPALLIF
jgi:hypothetical protein